MFEYLPIEPLYLFGTKNKSFSQTKTKKIGDGAEVLKVYGEESRALYIDGKRVLDYDRCDTEFLMREISEHTDGHLAAYGEAAASFHRKTGESLYNESMPDNPRDIIFSQEITTISLLRADDIEKKLNTKEAKEAEFLVVRIRDDGMSKETVRNFTDDKVNFFKIF